MQVRIESLSSEKQMDLFSMEYGALNSSMYTRHHSADCPVAEQAVTESSSITLSIDGSVLTIRWRCHEQASR